MGGQLTDAWCAAPPCDEGTDIQYKRDLQEANRILLQTNLKTDDDHRATSLHLKTGAGGTASVVCANQTDCTAELQLALDDPKAEVEALKFAAGRQWVARPLFLRRSGVAVVLEAGVVLQARRGFFHGKLTALSH